MANEHINKAVLGDEVLLDLTSDTATAADVAAGKTLHLATGARAVGNASYAGSPTVGGNANSTNAILYGAVDSTSTATAFTATIDGLDALTDGTCVMLHNGVVTSAAGFTVNINSLGAKKCYNNMTNATQDTTIFNVAYTMMFVYAEDLDGGNGGFWIYRGYDGNTNTIGYQLRGNSSTLPASDKGYRYRLWFTSADGTKWVPANKSTSTNATASRTPNTTPIDPFGPIVYYGVNGTTEANANLTASNLWTQYTISLGYSFNTTGAALVLSYPAPVWVKCTPQSNGSATLDGYAQSLPSTNDGKIYIWLGRAYSATNIELFPEHPVLWHDGTGIRIWTGAASSGGPSPSSTTPAMDGTAAVGTSTDYARADHVHPTDTSRQATLVSGTNIKTINGEPLLGSGNISISGGGGAWDDISGKPFSDVEGGTPTYQWTCTITSGTYYSIPSTSGTTPVEGFNWVVYVNNDVYYSAASAYSNYSYIPLEGKMYISINSRDSVALFNFAKYVGQEVNIRVYAEDAAPREPLSGACLPGSAMWCAPSYYIADSTSSGTSTKTPSIAGGANLVGYIARGTTIYMYSTNNNSASNQVNLMLNSTLSLPVYYKGAITSSTNKPQWTAKSTVVFVWDGTKLNCVGWFA